MAGGCRPARAGARLGLGRLAVGLPGAGGAADRPPGPQPQRLHRPGGASLARLHSPLLRALGGPGHRRAEADRRQRGRDSRLRQPRAGRRRTRLLDRERKARLARPEVRSPQGRRHVQDRHLPRGARRGALRLRRAGPQPGDQIAPAAAPPLRLSGARQRLRAARVPRHHAGARPRGDRGARVQPHPPVRLRRLPGRLVRRVERRLDGGRGLQRHRRLPALRAPLGEALRHAADRELDQGVRLDGLEQVARSPLRALDRAQRLVARRAHQAGRLLRRRLQLGDRSGRRLELQPGLRPLRRRPARVAHRCRFPGGRPLSRRLTPGQPADRRAHAGPQPQPHDLPAAPGARRRRARRGRPRDRPARDRRRPRPGRQDRQRAPASPPFWSTPTPAPRASAPGASTGPT